MENVPEFTEENQDDGYGHGSERRSCDDDKDNSGIEKIDRLSELPEPICHHILSFLPSTDVIKTPFLSRRWRFLWHTCSSYEFDQQDFGITSDHVKNRDPVEINFPKFVGTTLKRRERYLSDLTIEKLSICMHRLSRFRHFVAKWIAIALNCNLKELHIATIANGRYGYSCVPRSVLQAIQKSSITKLELTNVWLENRSWSDSWNGPPLEKLVLTNCSEAGSMIIKILRNCPKLKSLYLERIEGKPKIMVSSETLVEFEIRACEFDRIVVDAPNLKFFGCCEGAFASYNINNFKIDSYRALQTLKLCRIFGMTDSMVEDVIGRNEQLERLEIGDSLSFKTLVISSTKLKFLRLVECESLEALKLDAPNLEKLEFLGDLIDFTSLRTSSVLEADIGILNSREPRSLVWYTKVKDLCQKLRKSKRLCLSCKREEDLIVPTKWRKKLLPRVRNLKHLEVHIYATWPLNRKLLQGRLRWIFPSLRTLDIHGFKNKWDDPVKYHYKYKVQKLVLRPKANLTSYEIYSYALRSLAIFATVSKQSL